MENEDQVKTTANMVARTVIALINVLATRGAFKGEELQAIGELRGQCIQLIKLVEDTTATTTE